jgi:Protein of unknown function (DUF2971)
MPLYKYVTAERIDVLQNGLIRFSQPSALNDPWDLRPHVERLFTDDDIDQQVLAPMKPESDTQMIDFLSQTIENFNKAQGVTEISLDEIRKVVTAADDEFPGELRQLFEAAFAETAEKMRQIVPQIADIIPEAIDNAVGVLSLTEKPDHPLMWSHYANNHSGLVLGFDETNEFFRSPRHGQPDNADGARRVKYSSERPKFDPLVSLSQLDNLTDEDARKNGE